MQRGVWGRALSLYRRRRPGEFRIESIRIVIVLKADREANPLLTLAGQLKTRDLYPSIVEPHTKAAHRLSKRNRLRFLYEDDTQPPRATLPSRDKKRVCIEERIMAQSAARHNIVEIKSQ
jgi:hypothetical protein